MDDVYEMKASWEGRHEVPFPSLLPGSYLLTVVMSEVTSYPVFEVLLQFGLLQLMVCLTVETS